MAVLIEKRIWRFLKKTTKKTRKKITARRKRTRAAKRRVATRRAATTTRSTPAKTAARRPAPKTAARGANPLNVKRWWERKAVEIDSNRAASLAERNNLREARAAAAQATAAEKAKAKEARIAAAASRAAAARTGSAAPTTVRPAMKATQRKPTPAEVLTSAKCGATCDDGTACNNPSLGETCAAGHNPTNAKAKRKPSYRDNWNRTKQQPGETTDDFLRRERFERSAGQFLRDRAKERA